MLSMCCLRLSGRNAELVKSYWPLMCRLREVEGRVAGAEARAAAAVAEHDALAAEVRFGFLSCSLAGGQRCMCLWRWGARSCCVLQMNQLSSLSLMLSISVVCASLHRDVQL